MPGLLALTPPRKPARGREGDRLVLYLTLAGNIPFSSSDYNQITAQLAQRFYRTAGSLTSAVRETADALNHFLLERNLRTTGKGQYVVGRLVLGVLREAQFVLAQCGPTHAFQLRGGEATHFHDAQMAGRGLGVSQTTPVYFSRTDLRPGDLLVLCADPPDGWEAALQAGGRGAVEALRRRLLAVTGEDLNAVLIQVQAGKGNLNILPSPRPAAAATADLPAPAQPEAVPAPAGEKPAAARPSSQVQSGRPASRFARLLSGGGEETPAAAAGRPEVREAAVQPSRPAPVPAGASRPAGGRGRFVTPRATTDIPEIKRPVSPQRREFLVGLAKAIRGMRAGAQALAERLGVFLPNLLPGSRSDGSQAGGPSLAVLAVIIPLVVVTVAGVVYTRYGSTAQYQENYGRALEQAALARGQTNPTDVRHAWESALFYLDRAENHQETQESRNLRQEAQMALDNLGGILRLDFRPAVIGGLSRSVQVNQMAATDTDLYLLDAARGSVLRAYMTSQGYEVDPSFRCDPGQYGEIIVGALIDIKALPMSNIYNARLLAMDGGGNLLYCGLSAPVAVTLVPPQLGWRGIRAFSLDSDGRNLYVLDPPGNAVWQYAGNFGEFTGLPIIFFGEQVPQNMGSAIDLAANNADLYLLFEDGHVSACPQIRYDVVPVRCIDPVTFVDTRPERQPGPKITDAIFTHMTFAAAPDPSLYMFEPLTRAVYRFSPRSDSLELRGQFRATMEQNNNFTGPATAMAIGPNRYIFFSLGSQVYFAADVP